MCSIFRCHGHHEGLTCVRRGLGGRGRTQIDSGGGTVECSTARASNPGKFGQHQANLASIGRSLVETAPDLAEFGPLWARCWPFLQGQGPRSACSLRVCCEGALASRVMASFGVARRAPARAVSVLQRRRIDRASRVAHVRHRCSVVRARCRGERARFCSSVCSACTFGRSAFDRARSSCQ